MRIILISLVVGREYSLDTVRMRSDRLAQVGTVEHCDIRALPAGDRHVRCVAEERHAGNTGSEHIPLRVRRLAREAAAFEQLDTPADGRSRAVEQLSGLP